MTKAKRGSRAISHRVPKASTDRSLLTRLRHAGGQLRVNLMSGIGQRRRRNALQWADRRHKRRVARRPYAKLSRAAGAVPARISGAAQAPPKGSRPGPRLLFMVLLAILAVRLLLARKGKTEQEVAGPNIEAETPAQGDGEPTFAQDEASADATVPDAAVAP